MSANASAELAALLTDCALGIEWHQCAEENVRSLARLLSVGDSMQEVAQVVLHRLCNSDKKDAAKYLQAVKDSINTDLNVLFAYVCLEAHSPNNQKA